MIGWISGTWGTFNWTCPQPWGFIFGAYKILTQDIEQVMPSSAMSRMLRLGIDDICEEEKQRFDDIINEFINEYLDNEMLYISRKDCTPNYNTWGIYREGINEVNMYDFFSNYLNIDRKKVRHFLFKTLKEITETRCRLITPARYGPDEYRNEEMPMFSDLMLAPGELLSVELKTIWDNLSNLTQWTIGGRWYPGHESPERQLRYTRLNARMIDMFKHIWERLIIPSMKKIISDAEDPYEEFGIAGGEVMVPVAEMAQPQLPIEAIAKHERNIYETKYLDKWGKYGITKIDDKYAKMLDRWESDYIKSYHLGIGSYELSESPEPREVTRIKKTRQRRDMSATNTTNFDSDSSSSSSDEE